MPNKVAHFSSFVSNLPIRTQWFETVSKVVFLFLCNVVFKFHSVQWTFILAFPQDICPGTKNSEKMTRFPVLERHFLVLEHPFLFQNVIFLFQNILSCFRTSFSVLEHPFSVLERPFLLCPVLSRVPSRFLAVPARPVPDFGCPDPSRPLARFLACPVVPLSRDNDGTSVPLSRKVSLSRPVGNANYYYLSKNWRHAFPCSHFLIFEQCDWEMKMIYERIVIIYRIRIKLF